MGIVALKMFNIKSFVRYPQKHLLYYSMIFKKELLLIKTIFLYYYVPINSPQEILL